MRNSKNSKYWSNRFKQLEKSQHDNSAKEVIEIQKQFDKSQAAIESKINAWYARFAKNNEISIAEARKYLNSKELKEFKWSVEEYIKYGKENAVNSAWMKELENASSRIHISRLEALKIETQQECEKLLGGVVDSLDGHIKKQFTDSYYRTAYEIQKGTGIGYNIESVNTKVLNNLINKPWTTDDKNFKVRVGERKTILINNIHNALTQMCIQNQTPEEAIKVLAKTMKGDKSRAANIVMTESAYFSQLAQKDCFNYLGVEEYEIVATLDNLTDDDCAKRDGKHFAMSIFQAGVTAPPFHPRCRCCTCPWFDDEFTADEKRIARGDDGKQYEVPANMTYTEWHDKYVHNASTVGNNQELTNDAKGDTTKIAEGKNIVGDYLPSNDGKPMINNVIHAQGFDGPPQIVSDDVFDEKMKESGFYAERTYAASTQKELDSYRDELYGKHGTDWYIDCSTGGHQYGQGMYCASTYDTNDRNALNGISEEMLHYQQLNESRGNSFHYTEGLTLDPSAKILEIPYIEKANEYIPNKYVEEYVKKFSTLKDKENVDGWLASLRQIEQLTYTEPSEVIDEIYNKRAEYALKLEDLIKKGNDALYDLTDGKKYHDFKDIGVLAVEMGYDGIKATGHGKSGSYTVILNRTKLIIREGGSLLGN